MAFTRMRSRAHSGAIERVRAWTPPFAAVSQSRSVSAMIATMDEKLMTDPPPAFCR